MFKRSSFSSSDLLPARARVRARACESELESTRYANLLTAGRCADSAGCQLQRAHWQSLDTTGPGGRGPRGRTKLHNLARSREIGRGRGRRRRGPRAVCTRAVYNRTRVRTAAVRTSTRVCACTCTDTMPCSLHCRTSRVIRPEPARGRVCRPRPRLGPELN